MLVPLPCPFCGKIPEVEPKNPAVEGTTWGLVVCRNFACPAQPSVGDGAWLSDDRGSDEYKRIAIARWNQRS